MLVKEDEIMKILSIQNSQDRLDALDLCKILIEKNALIPIVGAGFSFDTPTDNKGKIPSVTDLHKLLYGFVDMYSGYEREELDEIKRKSLSEVADSFWSIYNRIPVDNLRSFFSFIENNFLNISFFKGFQGAFLRVNWPYLFTLNYDSLIEDYNKNYYPVIPFNNINHRFLTEKTRLYKLHGDAKKYLDTGDQKYIILSREQYIKSMMDPSNEAMLRELQTAFASKSILFFGCGLSEELDLLYSSQLAIEEKVKNIDPNNQAVIYISFEPGNEENSPFSLRTKDRLSQYGVTHVLRIFTEVQSEVFFNELAEHSIQIPKPGIDSFLDQYSAMRYLPLEQEDKESRNFLFQENLVWKEFANHTITIPGYYVKRSQMEPIVKSVLSGEPIYFISGNFFSGKTFLLIELSKYFGTKKVYIFPSGTNLTDTQLDFLLTKENSLYCFDSKSLSTAQIKKISQNAKLNEIKARRSCAIIVIDASDAPMYKYIFEARNLAKEFPQTRISGILDADEEKDFNKKIGVISLPPYSTRETLLDYIVRNEKELLLASESVNHFLEPNKQLLVKNLHGRIKALIMLATEIRISASRAIQFGIDNHINDIIKCCQDNSKISAIEKDYSIYTGDSSGYEFVCNSKYWIIRALSAYANTQIGSIDIIAGVYQSIVNDYKKIYTSDSVKFYQMCEPYYFFDHIQLLFNQRWFSNSSKLMNAIYDRLLPMLSDSYQFLHQKAKGKLIIAQVQIKNGKNSDSKETLNDALLNIIRAIKLAEQVPEAKNIKETLLHMVYTKGRILIACCYNSFKYVPQAVDTCHELYQMQKNIRYDAYDYSTGTGNDKYLFEKFKNTLMTNTKIRSFDDLDIEKTEFLLSHWTGKAFRIIKKKHAK